MICFHLGYPKAASTTLQKTLFDRHSQLVNLGLFPQANVGRDRISAESSEAPILHDKDLRRLHNLLMQSDGISYPEDEFVGDKMKDNNTRTVKGKVGNGNGGNVYIRSRYGEIKLQK